MAKIISDDILYASQFVQYYTGKSLLNYNISNGLFNYNTLNGTINLMAFEGIDIGEGVKLSNISKILNKVPEDAYFVMVQFLKQENSTEHEYRLMRIQKRYIKRFMKNMKENQEE